MQAILPPTSKTESFTMKIAQLKIAHSLKVDNNPQNVAYIAAPCVGAEGKISLSFPTVADLGKGPGGPQVLTVHIKSNKRYRKAH